MTRGPDDHARRILDQFTRQAIPFSRKEAMSREATLRMIVEACEVGPRDEVLDVACGPGLTACALAEKARHVTGIDITPAMLEQARSRQRQLGRTNLSWQQGDVMALPHPDATFTVVFTRYSLHHMLQPADVLAEMVRVSRPGGRIVVVDMFTFGPPEDADAFNEMERLRDASHVAALPLGMFYRLAEGAGLADVRMRFYRVDMEVEAQLRASFPATPDHAQRFRDIIRGDIGRDRLGIAARQAGAELHFSYPIVIVTGQRPTR